jgi:DNA-binding response OmpR family regulator
MEQLRQRFRERMAARASALRAAMADMELAREESIAAIRRIGHALHGSGGTYGFPDVSAAAFEVETAPEDSLVVAVEKLLAILDAEQRDPDGQPDRMLLIDDDPETEALLGAIVAPLGTRITCVDTAGQARRILAEQTFSVVVLDLVLPDADGRTVLLWMREQESLADTPVFVMSGLGSARVQAECYSIGADGFFEKPIDPDIVRAAISARLAARQRREVRTTTAPSADAAAGPDSDSTASASASIVPPAGKRVLLVEDDDLVATIVKHRLTRAGFEIIHYADGIAARDNANADGLCLGILDIKIPGIDGFELLENLRSRPEFARVPFIILTALGGERDVVRGLSLGASDYILKPFSPAELLARVQRLLQPA